MLLLKRHLVELVRRGKKRQTIRLWSRPVVRVGQISYTPGLGRMKITAVDQLANLNALTEADAQADGFDTLAALKAEIRKIYGGASQIGGRAIFRIKFEWPIDEAGRKLVMESKGRGGESANGRKPCPSPARPLAVSPARGRGMSRAQREMLRDFVVAKRPHR
ncbi:MAG TPA: ASCH domain-containing protein [Phycisphaerae bacterium]|nr:ASCH domain-containing protein [Phycisphaerae bacterium]